MSAPILKMFAVVAAVAVAVAAVAAVIQGGSGNRAHAGGRREPARNALCAEGRRGESILWSFSATDAMQADGGLRIPTHLIGPAVYGRGEKGP